MAPVYRSVPESLHDVASAAQAGYSYVSAVKEFIDHVIRGLSEHPYDELKIPIHREAYEQEPPFMDEPIMRAHLAGMAEYMAHLSNAKKPEWVEEPIYFLEAPVFFGGAMSRDITTRDTPAAFRRRLLFCGRPLLKLHRIWGSKAAREA